MSALPNVARFELRQLLRRISTWVYVGLFFAAGVLAMMAFGGVWDQLDLGDPGLVANSPRRVAGLLAALFLFALPVVAALAGRAGQRDFEHGTHPLVFTTPVGRGAYVLGRWLGSTAAGLVVLLAAPLGMAVGAALPWLEPQRVAPFDPLAYLIPVALILVPNLVVTSAIFVGLAVLTRRMVGVYVGAMALLVGWTVAGLAVRALESERLAQLGDPFAIMTLGHVTRYWTVSEQNSLHVPLAEPLLLNRLLWLGIAAAVVGGAVAAFRMRHPSVGGPSRRAPEVPAVPAGRRLEIPDPARRWDLPVRLRQATAVFRRSVREVVRNVWFGIFAFLLVVLPLVASLGLGEAYDTPTFPVTYQVADLVVGGASLFLLLIVTVYAGELVWNERETGAAPLHDVLPTPDWVALAGKFAALAAVLAVLHGVLLGVGLLIQAAYGFFEFEIGVWIRTLFGVYLPVWLLLAVLAMTVHVAAAHKYVGHVVLVLAYVGMGAPAMLGVSHNLLAYGSLPTLVYSDLNGFGHGVEAFLWFLLFWGLVAVLLAMGTSLLWPRGAETRLGARLRGARLRLTRPRATAAAAVAALALGTGGWVFYNTAVLNEFSTAKEARRGLVEYERRFKRFEGRPQPRVAAVRLRVDLFPEEQEARFRGTYALVNRTAEAIDTVFVDYPANLRVRSMSLPGAERVLDASDYGFHAYRLARPLAPGDTTTLRFDLALETPGFTNEPQYGGVVGNGSFVDSSYLPSIGYNPGGELTDRGARADAGLPPRPRAAPLEDTAAHRRNFISRDADWVDFEAVVGTDGEQTAVAPGYLVGSWREGERRYFHYRMDAPILNFYAFLSGRYEVARDRRGDVAIEVYHHPRHDYNVGRMIRATERSLDYYEDAFGPYQHRQVRIFEFPRYQAFAQSFANTIPYSEAIGFIADVERGDLDYPFFVTAHEVAHQWWGHQVVGADVQGAAMLSETLAEYSALMVMEREYGRDDIGRFLEHEREAYLKGRTGDVRGETPLVRAEGQPYLHYNKGALAMYALRDLAGERAVNAALRDFLEEWRFAGPPYPTSRDLLRHLRARLPDSLHGAVEDWFERVTLWDLSLEEATARPLGGGRWEVALTVEARKLHADSLGVETEAPMDEPIEVEVRGADGGEPLHLARHRLVSGTQTVRIVVEGEPRAAELDPRRLRIEREVGDNEKTVERTASGEGEEGGEPE